MAQKQLTIYAQSDSLTAFIFTAKTEEENNQSRCKEQPTVAALSRQKCSFCGTQSHEWARSSTRNSVCKTCKKKMHFAYVCRSPTATAINCSESLLISSVPSLNFFESVSRTSLWGKIKDEPMRILVDTGSSENFIYPYNLKILGSVVMISSKRILMASSSHSSSTLGHCVVSLSLNVKLSIMANLCSDIILGHKFLNQHSSVEIPFGRPLSTLTVCGLTTIKNVPYPSLFTNLTSDYAHVCFNNV